MNNFFENKNLFLFYPPYLSNLFSKKYPWEILPNIKETIALILKNGLKGFTFLKENVLVGENVKIYPTATIDGPAIIGSNTIIRPGAFLRENVIIGENCVIGNSTELKNVILLNYVQVPHYNYVGDSILGNHTHLGAGSICSNLRNDNCNVFINCTPKICTNLRKVGAFLGDFVNAGCGVILNPGTVIGNYSMVYPGITIKGIYEPKCIIIGDGNIKKLK